MTIYTAARYSRREEMLTHAFELEALGHVVTSRWIREPGPTYADLDAMSPYNREAHEVRCAEQAVEDLALAVCCLSFTEPPGIPNDSRGGRHVEFGYALGLDLRLIIVGPREHVFHSLPGIEQYDIFEECLAELGTVKPIPPGRVHDAAFVSNPLDLRDAHENREAPIDA